MNIDPAIIGQPASRPAEAILGIGYELLISAEQTNGLYELFHFVVPKGLGPPLHKHTREDECYLILRGEFEMTIGENRVNALKGQFLHLPRDVPHSVRNIGNDTGSFLCWVTPGNLGPFFDTFKKPWPADEIYPPMQTTADIQMMVSVAEKYGIEVLPPG